MLPRRLGPRFALEALFLILLAVGAGFADLSAVAIVLIMLVAWVLVALLEFTSERLARSFPPLWRYHVPAQPMNVEPAAEQPPQLPPAPPPEAATVIVAPPAEAPPQQALEASVEPELEPAPAAETGPPEEPEPEPPPEVIVAQPVEVPGPEPRPSVWQRWRQRPQVAPDGEEDAPREPRHVRLLSRRSTEVKPADGEHEPREDGKPETAEKGRQGGWSLWPHRVEEQQGTSDPALPPQPRHVRLLPKRLGPSRAEQEVAEIFDADDDDKPERQHG